MVRGYTYDASYTYGAHCICIDILINVNIYSVNKYISRIHILNYFELHESKTEKYFSANYDIFDSVS